MPTSPATYLLHLECAECRAIHPADQEQHLCGCGGVLLARYDLARLASDFPRERLAARPWQSGLWRYAELLPLADPANRVSLGEGMTPLLPLDWLGTELGITVWLKDEGLNPTGAFKARGAAVGVSRAKELGAKTIALPTAGNAGAAWAAYGARAGIPVIVAMPKDAPPLTQREAQLYGARLHLVNGLISDAGAWIAAGVMPALSRNPTGWKAKRRSAWRLPNSSIGKRLMSFSIPPAAVWDCSASGRPSRSCARWAGLRRIDPRRAW